MDPYLTNRQDLPDVSGQGLNQISGFGDQVTNMAKALIPEYLREQPYPKHWPTEPGKMQSVEPTNFAPMLTVDLLGNAAGLGAKAVGAGLKGAIFAGPSAWKAPQRSYDLARSALLNAKKDPSAGTIFPGVDDSVIRKLWAKTGISPGLEGGLRHEIQDSALQIKDVANPEFTEASGKVYQMVHHPKLFEAYPWIRETPLTLKRGNMGGVFDPLERSVTAQGRTPDEFKHSLIHELQHVIQEKEGTAPWGNPWGIRDYHSPNHASVPLWDDPLGAKAFQMYKRMGGEVEAENASNRASGRQYYTPPWLTEETTRANQLVPHHWLKKQSPSVQAAFEQVPNLEGDMAINPMTLHRLKNIGP